MKEYKYNEWRNIAEELHSVRDTQEFFARFPLAGKTIRNIRILGHDYSRYDYALEYIWEKYCEEYNVPEEIYELHNDVSKIDPSAIPDDFADKRIVQLDEPFILEFTDGQRMELESSIFDNEILITFNEIPGNAEADINYNNIDGNVIFSNCLGRTINEVRFVPNQPCGIIQNSADEELIPEIVFVLDNNLELHINGWLDFFEIWVSRINEEDIVPILWKELKKGIKG